MSIRLLLLLMSLGAVGVSTAAEIAVSTATAAQPIAEVSVVKARTGSKVSRFADAGNREFAVSYDANGRVSSVTATLRRHIADVLSIGYAPDGRIATVVLANGDMLYYSYAANGARTVRDRAGNIVTATTGAQPTSSIAIAGDSNPLPVKVARMDALLHALGPQ